MTHPFHPLHGREFQLLTYRQAWGEDRVYFRDDTGRLHHMPVGWTTAARADPFKMAAEGRCRFRTEDLVRLADLVEGLKQPMAPKCKDNIAASVKRKMPAAEGTTSLRKQRALSVAATINSISRRRKA